MSKEENEEFIVNKKFKSSHEKKEENSSGGHVLSVSKAETEAGSYFLGPVIKKYFRAPVTQCLARKKGTDNCYLMKILILDDSDTSDKCSFIRRTVFHNEYSILPLLKNCPGVIQLRDFFKDHVSCKGQGKVSKRVCMVLECLVPHGHHNTELIPLNHYLKEEKLSEMEALLIFYNLLLVIEDLHSRNVVHRYLKLSNVILNRKTLKVKLIDFYYAKLLSSNREAQCRTFPEGGEEAYPKTRDLWSAGVILYAMLFGGLPIAGSSSLPSNRSLANIYIKVMEENCSMLNSRTLSDGTKDILRNILCTIPQFRLKASEAADMVSTLLALQSSSQSLSLFNEGKTSDQIVPECPDFESKEESKAAMNAIKSAPAESECERKTVKQVSKTPKTAEDESTTNSSKASLLNSKDIKKAMLRLGVTSVNSINALSFGYARKSSCRS